MMSPFRKTTFGHMAGNALAVILVMLSGASTFGTATFPFNHIPDQTTFRGEAKVVELKIDLASSFAKPSEAQILVRSSNVALISPAQISFSQSNGILNLNLRLNDCSGGFSMIELIGWDQQVTNRTSFFLSTVERGAPPIGVGALSDRTGVAGEELNAGFTIYRDICSTGVLTFSATSSNTQLLPRTNITVEGSGTNWLLHCLPLAAKTGQTFVNVTASDGSASATSGFVLTIIQTNTLGDPVLRAIPDETVEECTPVIIPLFLDKVVFSELTSDQFSVGISNTNLLPRTGISFVKNSTNFSLRIEPAPNTFGTAIVTIGFRSGTRLAQQSFILTVVNPGVDLVIGAPNPIEGFEDAPIVIKPAVEVRIPCSPLTISLTAKALNSTLFPSNNVTVLGSGTNWTIVLNPATNQSGESEISLSVADSRGFETTINTRVIVPPVNHPPLISRIEDQKLNPGESGTFPFSVYERDIGPSEITVRAYSSNTNIVADTDLKLSNQGTNYVLTVRAQTNVSGTAEIFIQAWDSSKAMAIGSFFLASGSNAELASILNIHIQRDHGASFEVSGHPGATNYLQTSSDLIQWQKGAIIQLNSSGKALWTNSTTRSRMFFRLQN